MNIGIPRERGKEERRAPLTPRAVRTLVGAGHRVWVERGAGAGAHFSDEDYLAAGATIVFDEEEPYQRAELVLRVGMPEAREAAWLRQGQALLGFLHLAAAGTETVRALLDRGVTAIGFEVIEEADGRLPVLTAMSELAGQLSIHIAAQLLQSHGGGRGVLLGGAPGIPAATLVILGAGTVGTAAARTALGCGAHVLLLDAEVKRLRAAMEQFPGRLTTLVAHPSNLERAVAFADALIGCVLIHGRRAPVMVTRSMVSSMRPGSVILDVSIDQGGCVETSRPTTLSDPTFVAEGVVHYCVPNMAANVARSATRALSNAALPYVRRVADQGIEEALRALPALARGVYTHAGHLTRGDGIEVPGVSPRPLSEVLRRPLAEGQPT